MQGQIISLPHSAVLFYHVKQIIQSFNDKWGSPLVPEELCFLFIDWFEDEFGIKLNQFDHGNLFKIFNKFGQYPSPTAIASPICHYLELLPVNCDINVDSL
jgi:hypothetical protein